MNTPALPSHLPLRAKSVLVLGLGESGLAMVRWCVRQGAKVLVADSRQAPPAANLVAAQASGARVVCGPFAASLLDGVDVVGISPGLPVAGELPRAALARGLPVVSEIELFAWALRDLSPAAQVLAITGSNGKTTTTALTAHLVNAGGLSAIAAGNISPSALDALIDAQDRQALPKVWVLELSSFQLETTFSLAAAGATVLNISEDHLDRYAGLDGYADAKARVFAGNGVMVLNRDDARVMAMRQAGRAVLSFGLDAPATGGVVSEAAAEAAAGAATEAPARATADFGYRDGWLVRGDERLVEAAQLSLSGLHNVANALAALALCAAIGLNPRKLLPALCAFKGLPHRVEWVAAERLAGGAVDYYDDSKGTNVGATLAALSGMGRPVAIILGGDGKGQDFAPLKDALRQHGRAVALIGRDAAPIAAAIAGCGLAPKFCADMAEAVAWCRASAQPGDAVLLSPACASLDMYRNYAHRAEVFIATAEGSRNFGYNPIYFLLRHGVFLTVGLVAAFAVFQVPLATWQKLSPWLFVGGFALLVLVLIPHVGREVNGARRWLPLYFANLQPSELMKLFAVLYAADYTVRKMPLMDDLKRAFLPLAAAMVLVAGMLLMEPDFGAFVVIVCIAMGILFLGGMRAGWFFALVGILIVAFLLMIWLSPYRRERIFGYMDPWADPFGKGYQLSHALIAFGRGEITGVGLGASVEKLFYLPEAHTDFLLAVIAEELGFFGVATVVVLFTLLIQRAFAIGRQAVTLDRLYPALVAQGIGIWFGIQSFINMGVNMGLLPTKGLTLPLMSFGGSGILANCVALAILLRIDFENRQLMGGRRA